MGRRGARRNRKKQICVADDDENLSITALNSNTVEVFFWMHNDNETNDESADSAPNPTNISASSVIPAPFLAEEFTQLDVSVAAADNDMHGTTGTTTPTSSAVGIHGLWKALSAIVVSSKGVQTAGTSISASAATIRRPTRIQLHAWSILLSKAEDISVSKSAAAAAAAAAAAVAAAAAAAAAAATVGASSSLQRDPTTTTRPNNLVLISPTGSGKTYAYGLPLVLEAANAAGQKRASSSGSSAHDTMGGVTSVVLVPTRELARQVQVSLQTAIRAISAATAAAEAQSVPHSNDSNQKGRPNPNIAVLAWYGGMSRTDQLQELLNLVQLRQDDAVVADDPLRQNPGASSRKNLAAATAVIVAATTGRLLDFLTGESKTKQAGDPATNTAATLAQPLRLAADTGNECNMTRIRSIFTRQLQTVVLDEADRLAMNKDLCEQTATILQLLTGSISSNDLPTTAISEGQRQNEMVRKVMCSATWPDRATPAWKSWVSLSNEPCIVVRVDAVAVTAHARPKAPGQLKNDTPDAKEKKENDVADNEIDQDASGNELDMVVDNHKPNSTASNNSSSSKDLLLSRIPANLTQVLHVCAEHKKPKKLLATLETIRDSMDGGAQQRNRPRGIVFFAKIKTVQYIATFLEREASQLGYAISSFHSQMSQPAREQALRDFAAGKVSILLATDIAARGIHANNVKFVINYDFPSNLEQYVHRCGRAGRGGFKAEDNGAEDATQNGNQGTVYSFFTRNLAPLAADLITLLQSSNQWVDPNLLLLVEPQKRAKQSTSSTKKEKRKEQPSEADNDNWGGDDDGPDDPFMNLSAKRIVLKRALNVSDASDDDDEDDK